MIGGLRWAVGLYAIQAALILALALLGRALPVPRSEITFYAQRGGNYEILLLDVRRGLVHNLTRHPEQDIRPVWSPDGTRLLFYSTRSRQPGIYRMNADGSGVRLLRSMPGSGETYPAWSPDGQRILFASAQRGSAGIYIMDADGSNLRRLTNLRAALLAWSPDGRQVVFMSECENNCDLYIMDIMDADGGNLRPLTDNLVFDVFPSWSPDSRQVAYMSNRDRYFEIYAMDVVDGRTGLDCPGLPEGCPLHRLTVNPAFDGFPAWSPDGRQIAFSSDRAGSFDLYLAPSDCYRLPGGCEASLRRVTDTEADDLVPSWSPDGRQIAFISGRSLYLIAAAGGIPQQLAAGITRDQWVAWRP